jgi:uncharacterized membrane protein YedE/YeeE
MAATETSVTGLISLAFGILGVALMLLGAITVLLTFRSAPIFGGGVYRDAAPGQMGTALFMGIGAVIGGAIFLAMGIIMLGPLTSLI